MKNLDEPIVDEIIHHFSIITQTFDKLNSSVMCTSVIYPVKSYHVSKQNLFVNYHIDSDEKIIRVTSIDVL